ncbi:MAG: hypothetical protein SOR89_03720 [Ndongobacter sp.]|nr:hypothetical protein [Ndongobacter sp.]
MIGIYTYECLENGHQYLGGAYDVEWAIQHVTALLNKKEHPCRELQGEWTQYGPNGFEVGIPEQVEEEIPNEDVSVLLQEMIDEWMEILEDVEFLGTMDASRCGGSR